MRSEKENWKGRMMRLGIVMPVTILFVLGACTRGEPVERARATTPEVKAPASLAERAAAGDAAAQLELGDSYAEGKGVPKSEVVAVEWWQKAADQGNANAQIKLARAYSWGQGVLKDAPKAIGILTPLAEKGNLEAQVRLGIELITSDNPREVKRAVDWIRKSAEGGNAGGQFAYGTLYLPQNRKLLKGVTVPSNETALAWITKSAEQGYERAQSSLSSAYAEGTYAPKDNAQAVFWLTKSAEQGDILSMELLASRYYEGDGVPRSDVKAMEWWLRGAQAGEVLFSSFCIAGIVRAVLAGRGAGTDLVEAYAWANIGASGEEDLDVFSLRKDRDALWKRLSPEERLEGERLSASWKPGQSIVREGTALAQSGASAVGGLTRQGTGTAFYVSSSGLAVTSLHVVDGCREVRVEGANSVSAMVSADFANDIALIQVSDSAGAVATFSDNPGAIKQGAEVVVFGFPLNAVLSSGGNVSPGVVSALTGLGNNTSQIQITAPIQPGSSGSPVFNRKGQVVGIVTAKLSDKAMARETGEIGQNVNFAVSGQNLRRFLDANGVEYETGGPLSFKKSPVAIADRARKFTFVVECWK